MPTECEVEKALRKLTSKSRHHNKEASPGEHRHGVKTHLAGGDDRLEEASILA
jgi:hypothetical protein